LERNEGVTLIFQQIYRQQSDSTSNGKEKSMVTIEFSKSGKSTEKKEFVKTNEKILKRQKEIILFSNELKKYNLSFSVLASHHFKNKDEKETAIAIVKFITDTPSVKETLLNTKTLPDKTIMERFQVSKSFIQKNKLYIIAIFLLLMGPYTEIKSYLLEGLFK
jgi:hypothetical protein